MKPVKTPRSKSQLAIALSKLKVFTSPRPDLEQYTTDSEIAADMIWAAYMAGELEDAIIADLGCGTGILGIGTLIMGAGNVFFVDKDKRALEILRSNLEMMDLHEGFDIINSDVSEFTEEVDMVIQNPPFGTQEIHADKKFLEHAMRITDNIYSFHKTATAGFIVKLCKDNGFMIKEKFNFAFPLKQTMKQHKKKIERIEVSCFHIERQEE
ncbi:MAG: METTL5 family protein [Candidatus Woesearchaeota archaeon]